MTAHIRIRSTWRLQWQWELVTADGHIANLSQPFVSRESCEADAKQQGLPVKGLNPRVKVRSSAGSAKWRFPCTHSGLWQWRRFDSAGALIEESSRAFLTRDDCVADAEKHGYFGRKSKVPATTHKQPALDDVPSSR